MSPKPKVLVRLWLNHYNFYLKYSLFLLLQMSCVPLVYLFFLTNSVLLQFHSLFINRNYLVLQTDIWGNIYFNLFFVEIMTKVLGISIVVLFI